eukprot:406012-Rhodomonas_salina.2
MAVPLPTAEDRGWERALALAFLCATLHCPRHLAGAVPHGHSVLARTEPPYIRAVHSMPREVVPVWARAALRVRLGRGTGSARSHTTFNLFVSELEGARCGEECVCAMPCYAPMLCEPMRAYRSLSEPIGAEASGRASRPDRRCQPTSMPG